MTFRIDKEYFRSSLFGIEDALVSTAGTVVGVTIGSGNKQVILMAVFVYIIVEAVSMGAGQYLSSRAVHELNPKPQKDNLIVGAIIMFISYALAGLIPVLPVFFLPVSQIIIGSITLSFITLFSLGYIKGRIVGVSPTKSAFEMLIIGGLAALAGILVGLFLKI